MNIGSRDLPKGDAAKALLEHTKWIAERFERMNEQLLTLSSTFIGFLAVELGLLGQTEKKTFEHNRPAFWVGVAGLVFLAISIISFFVALWSLNFDLPKLEDFQGLLNVDKEVLEVEPLRMMLSTDEGHRNIQKSLESENLHLNRYYKAGLIFGATAQILIAILLFTIWV
jgi:hypothetical protein